MATIAELAERLARGDEQITARERARGSAPEKWIDEWLRLLQAYEVAVDASRGTCLRRERAARHPDGAGRYVERRLPSIR